MLLLCYLENKGVTEMETVVTIILIGLLIFISMRFMPTKGVKNISPKELQAYIDNPQYELVDVRTQGEYARGRMNAFRNLPVGSDFSILPKDKGIVVVCQSGVRSNQVCKQLVKQGYTDVINVRRGLNAMRVEKK